MAEIVLIDLSSLAYPIWHTSASEPDPNTTSTRIVQRVRALATEHQHVAICCDSGRSFRHEIDPAYKGQRPEQDAMLRHQVDLACEGLSNEGYPVWRVRGFEADDLIATAVRHVLATQEDRALIVSADKDLLQLVGDRVFVKSVKDGTILDADVVYTKFGVSPSQMRDYLCLVGDASDNVRGASGIGPKKAAQLLATFGTLTALYAALGQPATHRLAPSLVTALREFEPRRATVEALITLRTDAEIPYHEVMEERRARDLSVQGFEEMDDMDTETPQTEQAQTAQAEPAMESPAEAPKAQPEAAPAALVRREPDVLAPAPAEWERQLDPRSLRDAKVLAQDMFQSRMFSAYGTPQGVLSTVMMGRELGLPAMASLRSIHIIEGRHSLSAQAMVALVLRGGFAEFFEPVSFSDTEATFETQRKGGRNPVRLTHTIEMAQRAWGAGQPDTAKWDAKRLDAWQKSGWGKTPADMLVARATSRLARMVYPDLLAGLYTPDELHEISERQVA
jgi:5'-3' exonuclease